MKGLVKLAKKIFCYTFFIEGIGIIPFAIRLVPQYGLGIGIWKSIFMSVSSFCNAGFDLLGANSLAQYRGDTLIDITVMVLTILGGIGFIVLNEIIERLKNRKQSGYSLRKTISKFSVHTKIVIISTLILIIVGAVGIYVFEKSNPETLAKLSTDEQFLVSTFHSVNSRTSGMSTFKMSSLRDSSKIITLALMMIGGSPGGTAGGIKTVTFVVIILLVINTILGRKKVVCLKHEFSNEAVYKAITIVTISFMLVVFSTLILTTTDPSIDIMDLLFESISAFGTVGLSLGITGTLSIAGKIIIMILMYIGRVTTITMAFAMFIDKPSENENIQYPEAKLMIG